MQRTGNPALSANTFLDLPRSSDAMTIEGTVNKSFFLILLIFASAAFTWQSAFPGGWNASAMPVLPRWYFFALIGAFVTAIVIILRKTTAPLLAPVYAVLEGAALGVLSAVSESRFPGIVMQAVFCTFGTFLALLLAYRSNLIQVTENFKLGVVAATGGIALVYLFDLGLRFFGMQVPLIHECGPLGIGVSLVITIVAALNLVLDFDFIEKGAEQGAPKYMEWYSAFGLVVTLVWLYLEILRLLSKAKK